MSGSLSVTKNTRPDVNADKPFWEKTRPRYLLSGLLKCGVCNGNYTKISQNLFGCATARNKGTCDNRLNIRTDAVEAVILTGLKDHMMDPDLFKAFATEFIAETNRIRIEETADVDAARSNFDRVTQQIDKLVMAIADGADALPSSTLRSKSSKPGDLNFRRGLITRRTLNRSFTLTWPRCTGPRWKISPRYWWIHSTGMQPSALSAG